MSLYSPIEIGLLRAGVKEDQLNACMVWAIGEDWPTVPVDDIGPRLRRVCPEVRDEMLIEDGFKIAGEAYLGVARG